MGPAIFFWGNFQQRREYFHSCPVLQSGEHGSVLRLEQEIIAVTGLSQALGGVAVLCAPWHRDHRGAFQELFNEKRWAQGGIEVRFKQDNVSVSARRGTIRGLHFQRAPVAQAKLVTVLQGSILDVIVDIQPGSPTFGHHMSVELSDRNHRQLFVPAGFAHGFCTLTDHTIVCYKMSEIYAPAHESGLRWNDPALAIDWPVSDAEVILSERDRGWPDFASADLLTSA
jgi:dTDP-4-dehydrorhamnose 3,5-epimerase